jgi:hypothetical protein
MSEEIRDGRNGRMIKVPDVCIGKRWYFSETEYAFFYFDEATRKWVKVSR